MANDIYGAVNGVRNDIINEPLSTPLRDDTSQSIFIFGTAADGPLHVPTRPVDGDVESQFGTFSLNQYSDRSLLKAYYESLAAGGTDPNFNVRLIRVGNVSKAGIDLYEHRAYGSGDYSPTGKSLSVRLEFDTPGTLGNTATAYITGSGGLPTALTIGLPSGTEKTFYIDATGTTNGYIQNVSDLIEAVMSDTDLVSAGLVATTTLLEADYEFTYAEPSVDIVSDAGTSYGNNLVEIVTAYSESDNAETIPAGSSTYVFDVVLAKDTDDATPTVDSFFVVKTNEVAKTAALADVGYNTFTLSAASDPFWLTGPSTFTGLTVSLVRSGVTYSLTAQCTVDTSTGIVTIAKSGDFAAGYVLNDQIKVTYKYEVGYTEANVRSDLVSGNRGSYFVSGDTITFGAAQQFDVEASFKGIREFIWGSDIILVDAETSSIRFNNPLNLPDVGDTVVLSIRYLPELPAPTGTTLSDLTTQVSGFSGGSDAQSMSLTEYKKAVQTALDRTFGYPCATIIIAGAYLNDTVTGYNSETGLKETVNVGWHTVLSDYVIRKSKYVNECKAILSTKPMTTIDSESIESYIDSLITVSATDTLRPANIISNIDSYPLIITANDFIVAVPKVVNDSVYTTAPSAIYAVSRQITSKETSPIAYVNKMPDVVRGLTVPAIGWDKLQQINTMRYTFFHRDITSGTQSILPADAPTLAVTGSSLDRQYVLDVVYLCLRSVRQAMQAFIGQKNDDRTRTVMENVAKSVLKELSPTYITAYDVKVSADVRDKIDGNTKLKLLIKTAREIRTISEETRIKIV